MGRSFTRSPYRDMGLVTGDSTNLLTARVVDTNTMIPAYREFLVDVRRAE